MSVFNPGLAGVRAYILPHLPPVGARVAWIGDSITQFNHQNGSATNASLTTQQKGEIVTAQTLDPRFRCDIWIAPDDHATGRFMGGANHGVTGDTVSTPGPTGSPSGMLGRLNGEILPLRPDICIVAGGTNDVTASNNLSGLQSICATLLSNGIKPVLCTVRPYSVGNVQSAANQTAWTNLNAGIRAYAAATPSITLCDLAAAYGVPGAFASVPANYFAVDGLHPSPFGAMFGAQAIQVTLAKLIQPGNWFLTNFWNAGTNLLTPSQATLSGGTTGGVAYSTKGQLATGYTCYANNVSSSAVSLLPNSQTAGHSQQFIVTPGGTASLESFPFSLNVAVPAPAGSYVFGLAEVEFDGWGFWGGATFSFNELPSSANQIARANLGSAPYPNYPLAGRRWLATPPLKLDANGTGVGAVQVSVFVCPNGASGTGTYKVHRMGVFPIPDPHTVWNS